MNYGFETRCIHGNGTDEKTHSYGSVAVPIYQAATFAHPGIGQSTGYDYTRESNPTRTELEHTMSALEGAVDTVACANGMAASGKCKTDRLCRKSRRRRVTDHLPDASDTWRSAGRSKRETWNHRRFLKIVSWN